MFTLCAAGRASGFLKSCATTGATVLALIGFAAPVAAQDVTLHVTKLGDPQTPVAGEMFKYVFTIENFGPDDAENVLFTDTLPEGMTYVADNGFCNLIDTDPDTIECRPAGNAFSFPPFVLPAGESVTFEVWVDTDPGLLGEVTNLAAVTIDNGSFSITSFGDDVTFRSVADAVIYKFAANETVYAGQQLKYALVVDNWGPSNFWDVVVRDTLFTQSGGAPNELFVKPNGCSLAVRSCGGAIDEFDCNFALSSGIFELATFGANFLTPLAYRTCPGDPPDTDPYLTGRMIMTIDLTANEGGQLTNTATVMSGDETTHDPDMSNNTVTVVSSFQATSDLSLTKSVDAAPATPWIIGDAVVTYHLTVENLGPSVAKNVVLVDDLPAGVTVTNIAILDGASGSCTPGTPGDPADRLRCNLGMLDPDDNVSPPSKTVAVTVSVDTDFPVDPGSCTGLLNNAAWTYADQIDLNNDNDLASTSDPVACEAGLSVVKTAYGRVITGYTGGGDPVFSEVEGEVTAGEQIRYAITVMNNGPSKAYNVVAVDDLPPEVTFVSSEGAVCVPAGIGEYSCNLGDMAPNSSRSFNLYGVVAQNASGFLDNCVEVSSPITDPNPADNLYCLSTGTGETEVHSVANVSVAKWADADVYGASSTVKYTIEVTNRGPAAVENVLVRDYLPTDKLARYYFDSCGSDWSGAGDKEIDWTIPYLASGAKHSCNVYVTVVGSRGCIRNVAVVEGDALLGTEGEIGDVSDLFTGDNRARVDVLIQGRKFFPKSSCEDPPAFAEALALLSGGGSGGGGGDTAGGGGGGGGKGGGQGKGRNN